MWTVLIFCVLINTAISDDSKNNDKTVVEEKKLKYSRPEIPAELVSFVEPFHSQEELNTRWVKSQAKKDGVDASIAKYDGVWDLKEPKENAIEGDQGLVFSSEAKHGAIASKLEKPFRFEDKAFIVQYEVKFQVKHECGGAYVKLLADTPAFDIENFTDKTLYSIMFGPDKCGGDGKLHFIFQHENPITHKMEEKHAKKPTGDFGYIFDDGKTHLITLIVRPDNTFKILVDKVQVNEGSLLSDMEPPVNPPKQIDDPEDKKPDDWDDREKIPDPDATKPDDWDEDAPKIIADPSATKPAGWLDDEPELIADPQAVQPEDWDVEEDGEWEAPQINNPKCKPIGCGEWKAPMIKNPDYKGKWTPPLISNPNHKGIWSPRKIDNPDFFEDNNPFSMKPVAAVGFELWSMQSNILFDNIIITDDESTLAQWTMQTWDVKNSKEVAETPSVVGSMVNDFLTAANDKPWLYVVAVVAVLLPIILLYVFCFSGNKDDTSSHPKKTDEHQPDDIVENEEEEEGNEEEKDDTANATTDSSEKKKENEILENKPEQPDSTADEKEMEDSTAVQDDTQEEEKVDNADAEASSSPKTRSRRKTRKDN